MRYLRILLDPIKLKGDPEDEEQLRHDIYEKLQALMEAEVLSYNIDEDEEDEDFD
jgi:hypothetical protein